MLLLLISAWVELYKKWVGLYSYRLLLREELLFGWGDRLMLWRMGQIQ